jgi:hypothetical protein
MSPAQQPFHKFCSIYWVWSTFDKTYMRILTQKPDFKTYGPRDRSRRLRGYQCANELYQPIDRRARVDYLRVEGVAWSAKQTPYDG